MTASKSINPRSLLRGSPSRGFRIGSLARGILLASALVLFTSAAAIAGHATWMQAKAYLAQYLIAGAWQETLATGEKVPPWSWADTWPVALLVTPAGKPLYVLAGLSGDTLAFGPGMSVTGPEPGEVGTTILAGHKNTHFRFLRNLEVGDVVRMQSRSGQWYRYRIAGMHVANSKTETIPVQYQRDEILLTTCFPFGPGHYDSPLRFVVRGVRI